MTDIEVALELVKMLAPYDNTLCRDPDKLLALYRKCLAAVHPDPETP